MDQYDLIAIGAGRAGLAASTSAALVGARVALVEQGQVGGEGLWAGSVPSKALAACARMIAGRRRAAQLGLEGAGSAVDFERAMRWVAAAQRHIEGRENPDRLRARGIDVIEGTARFDGAHSVVVDGRPITARAVIIATGSRPILPAVDGLAQVAHYTNETVFGLTTLPQTMLVLGAGATGLELAQAFARLGSRVTVLETAPTVLRGEDHELAELLTTTLAADGVRVVLEHEPVAVAGARANVSLTAQPLAGGPHARFEANAILVAGERVADVVALELDRAGVELTRDGEVAVDERLRTTARSVWAAGDVIGAPRSEHVAEYEARLVARNALFPFPRKRDYTAVPRVIYTDPELARVGLTEAEARAQHGDRVRVWRAPLGDLDRAIIDGRTAGMVKIVADARGRILGGHVLSPHAGDMIGEIAMAMRYGLPVGWISNVVHPYPTYGEALRRAADEFYRARFTGLLGKLLRLWVRR